MTCTVCGNHLFIDPGKIPRITDKMLERALDRTTGKGRHHFTFNQLVYQVYRELAKKNSINLFPMVLFSLLLLGILSVVMFYIFPFSLYASLPFVISIPAVAWLVIHILKKPVTIPFSTIKEAIDHYRIRHFKPFEKMVEGKALENIGINEDIREIKKLLIVERNDIADMFILNRFPEKHETVVVSADKYPKQIYDIILEKLEKNRDLNVYLLHDTSEKGLGFKDRLLSDNSWHLKDKKIIDLGFFTENLKWYGSETPVWIPPPAESEKKNGIVILSKKFDNMLKAGYRVPADSDPPENLLWIVRVGVENDVVLFSSEYFEAIRPDWD